MHPIAVLPNPDLLLGSTVADLFLARGVATFRDACQWVKDLPYGSNSRFGDSLVLFEEGRGTCFSKHGVIARLAGEMHVKVHKNLGFYRLDDEIITGVNQVLRPYGLDFIPTMHCFLEHGSFHVDLTEGNCNGKNKTIESYDFVVRVRPEPSRDEVERLYATCFDRYSSIEPRLASLGLGTVTEVLKRCHQLASARCSSATQPSELVALHSPAPCTCPPPLDAPDVQVAGAKCATG
jgi:hypothetical protein